MTTIGPYEVLEELGRGAMGVVYRARQPGLERDVALKLLLGGQHAHDDERARFLREAQAAGRLRHPAIVGVHDVGVHEGQPYIVMDYIRGRSLDAVIQEELPDPRQAIAWVRVLAEALHHAHAQGVIHRDVKPANVLCDPAGNPYLGDFGLARDVGAARGLTVSGAILGTPAYMAPEQALGQAIDGRADVYALGALLYECPWGGPPSTAPTPSSCWAAWCATTRSRRGGSRPACRATSSGCA